VTHLAALKVCLVHFCASCIASGSLSCSEYTIEYLCVLQLYINGEFVGGADIIEEMSTKGELKELLSQ